MKTKTKKLALLKTIITTLSPNQQSKVLGGGVIIPTDSGSGRETSTPPRPF
jgi:hypothetical protein